MTRKNKLKTQNEEDETDLMLSVNYGALKASVHATGTDFVAKITGKMPDVNRWQFNAFIINFVDSLRNGSGLG